MTKTRPLHILATALCAASLAGLAHAAPAEPEEGFHAGLSLASARNKGSGDQGSSVGTSLGAFAGYRLGSGWSAELSHADMSGFLSCFTLFTKIKHCEDVQSTTALSGVYHAPIQPGWEAMLRAGVARTRTDVHDPQVQNGRGQSRVETEGVLGIGVQHALSRSLRLRGEFQTTTKTQVKLIGLSLGWHF